MSLIDQLNETLRNINLGNCSGGLTPFNDMMYFQKINPEESVVWHHTRWIQSKLADDEEIQLMTVMRWRKKPNDRSI